MLLLTLSVLPFFFRCVQFNTLVSLTQATWHVQPSKKAIAQKRKEYEEAVKQRKQLQDTSPAPEDAGDAEAKNTSYSSGEEVVGAGVGLEDDHSDYDGDKERKTNESDHESSSSSNGDRATSRNDSRDEDSDGEERKQMHSASYHSSDSEHEGIGSEKRQVQPHVPPDGFTESESEHDHPPTPSKLARQTWREKRAMQEQRMFNRGRWTSKGMLKPKLSSRDSHDSAASSSLRKGSSRPTMKARETAPLHETQPLRSGSSRRHQPGPSARTLMNAQSAPGEKLRVFDLSEESPMDVPGQVDGLPAAQGRQRQPPATTRGNGREGQSRGTGASQPSAGGLPRGRSEPGGARRQRDAQPASSSSSSSSSTDKANERRPEAPPGPEPTMEVTQLVDTAEVKPPSKKRLYLSLTLAVLNMAFATFGAVMSALSLLIFMAGLAVEIIASLAIGGTSMLILNTIGFYFARRSVSLEVHHRTQEEESRQGIFRRVGSNWADFISCSRATTLWVSSVMAVLGLAFYIAGNLTPVFLDVDNSGWVLLLTVALHVLVMVLVIVAYMCIRRGLARLHDLRKGEFALQTLLRIRRSFRISNTSRDGGSRAGSRLSSASGVYNASQQSLKQLRSVPTMADVVATTRPAKQASGTPAASPNIDRLLQLAMQLQPTTSASEPKGRPIRVPSFVRRHEVFQSLPPRTQHLVAAILRLQAFIRGMRGRVRAARMDELRRWDALAMERRLVAGILFTLLVSFSLFAFYICLLFSVKFPPDLALEWILASLASFLTDVLVQQPLVILVKTLLIIFIAYFSSKFKGASLTTGLLGELQLT